MEGVAEFVASRSSNELREIAGVSEGAESAGMEWVSHESNFDNFIYL